MITIPYLLILVMLGFAVFFYRAAEAEDESYLFWCGSSLLISALTIFWRHWGWLGIIFAQLALFVSITFFRMRRKK
jgi:hypothetical protein